jgi:hypothetical protein
MHETTWKSGAPGEAAPARHPAFKVRQKVVGDSSNHRSGRKFSVSLVAELSTEGTEGIAFPAGTGTPAQAFPSSEGETPGASAGGFSGPGLRHGSMDFKPCETFDSQIFRGGVSPLSCLEAFDQFGIKLPETGAKSSAKGREGHRTLEALQLAAYKKTLKHWEPTWSFSTKVGSCSSLMSNGPGHFVDKLHRSATFTSRTGFRSLTRWSFPPRGSGWLSMSECAPIISRAWTSSRFCDIFSGTFADPSSSSGIAEPSTSAGKCGIFSIDVIAFILNGFLLMLPNSTRRNTSGAKTTRIWPMALLSTAASLLEGSTIPCAGFAAHKNCSGHASMPPIYRGLDE